MIAYTHFYSFKTIRTNCLMHIASLIPIALSGRLETLVGNRGRGKEIAAAPVNRGRLGELRTAHVILILYYDSICRGAAETAVVEAEAEAPPVGGRRELSTWASLVSIMASRYLLSPAIAWSLIIALRKAGFFPPVAVDPVLTFVVLLQAAMPPAQNSVIMLQVVGDKLGAKKLSRMLFMLYLLAVVPMSFLVSFFLQTASLCA
ncbi:hypothetical protein T492DRAFT_938337 [Pavlovales sp. CCMP2436]|nr:hypothetical protein T492DRAFT_938337 [Pavlovales sp. CCMP2436]